ncbi:Uncharacterised protein [Mycobacteroides abscessus subsp. massiliense]|nr:Uncharacterised protein [Mycobacteroides abscessus subsp. massiliense]
MQQGRGRRKDRAGLAVGQVPGGIGKKNRLTGGLLRRERLPGHGPERVLHPRGARIMLQCEAQRLRHVVRCHGGAPDRAQRRAYRRVKGRRDERVRHPARIEIGRRLLSRRQGRHRDGRTLRGEQVDARRRKVAVAEQGGSTQADDAQDLV